jgi:hypothetical protein
VSFFKKLDIINYDLTAMTTGTTSKYGDNDKRRPPSEYPDDKQG